MSNTVIQLKWSELSATPTTLNVAEPAYSNTSGKLFIGQAGSQVIAIGGKYYVDIIDAATSANVANTLVKRDNNGIISASVVKADLYGNANSATQLQNTRWINLSGKVSGSASFNGTANADITVELDNTTVTPGDYGGATKIPTFTVDNDGRITAAANVDISTTLNIKADTGSNAIALLTDTLTFVGGDGITTSIGPTDNVAIAVDNTVIRTTGPQTIAGDLSITGNLTISGQTVTQNVSTLSVSDPLLYLAANNYSSDSVDIGFSGNYYDGSTNRHTGVVRKHGTDNVYIFTNYDKEFTDNLLNVSDPSLRLANTYTNITGGKVFGLSQAIAIADGGTNATSFPTGNLVFFNGTSLTGIANTGIVAGTYGAKGNTLITQVDAYGRVVAFTNAEIQIDTTQVVTGILPIARGGTNNNTYTTGGLLQYDGSKVASLANTGTAGTYGAENYIPVVTTDPYGRVSAISNTAIGNLSAAIITSGTLPVARGGTGNTAFTNNGILVGQGTSAVTTVYSSTEGHVLQINSSGVPVFAHLNGGSF